MGLTFYAAKFNMSGDFRNLPGFKVDARVQRDRH